MPRINISDKIGMPISPELDPRKTIYHSESDQSGSAKEKIEKMKLYFKTMWNRIDIDIRKRIFEIYENDLKIFNYSWNYLTNDIDFNLPLS